jgi:hypothetical protein
LHDASPPLTSLGRHVLTGSYHNYFRLYDTDTLSDVVLQADKSAFKIKKGGTVPGNKGPGPKNGRPLREAMMTETLDFNKKILHASWHPRENTIAVSLPSRSFGLPCARKLTMIADRSDQQPLHLQCCMMRCIGAGPHASAPPSPLSYVAVLALLLVPLWLAGFWTMTCFPVMTST